MMRAFCKTEIGGEDVAGLEICGIGKNREGQEEHEETPRQQFFSWLIGCYEAPVA